MHERTNVGRVYEYIPGCMAYLYENGTSDVRTLAGSGKGQAREAAR
jgi:hypothetical protein